MSDQIIIEYGAKLDKLQADLRKLEQQQLNIDKSAKKSGKTIQDESEKAGKSVNKVEKNVNGLDGAFKKVGAAIAGVFAVNQIINLGKKVVETTAEFQKFEAVLVNTLGSKSQAQAALAQIKDFAAKTPFGVAELTGSFVKLVNQGFKPTSDEMRKLGDIAASQGKSFDQLTEGIIDAQTGQFERLKEFGIRASKEGDKVKFTFKGVETQTDFTSGAIQKYILGLGDAVGVSGSMAAISETVGGQLSNLDDAFDSLYNTVGSGNSGVISTSIKLFADLVSGLELALTTEEQLQDKLNKMESSARENQFFSFLERDIQGLVKIGTDEAEARRLVFAAQIIDLEKDLDTDRKLLEKHQTLFGEFISDQQAEILNKYKKDIAFSESALNRLNEAITKIDNEQYKSSKKTQEEIDKEFKLRLDLLKKQEEFAVRRANLEGKTEGDIIKIHEQYNGKRIGLFKEFEKTREIEYQEFFIIAQELEKQHTQFIASEEQKRLEEIKAHRDSLLSGLELFMKAENNIYADNYNIQLNDISKRYQKGQITREQFEKETANLAYRIQAESIKREIDLIQGKLKVESLSYEQRLDLEEKLAAKRKELIDADLDDYKKKEEEKTKKEKEEAAKRLALQKQALNEAINLSGQLLSNIASNDLARTNLEIENERSANQAATANLLANLDKRKEAGLLSESQLSAQKIKIQKDAAKRESDLKRKQFEAQKKADLTQIEISTAVAVVKSFATYGFTPAGIIAAAGALAEGGLEYSFVSKKPTPKFKKGVIDLEGKGTSTSDSIDAKLSKGESVMTAKETKEYKPLFESIRGGYFDKYAHENLIVPALKKQEEERRKRESDGYGATKDLLNMLKLNGLVDTSHLERLTKKNNSVKINNVSEIVSGIEKAVKPKSHKGL